MFNSLCNPWSGININPNEFPLSWEKRHFLFSCWRRRHSHSECNKGEIIQGQPSERRCILKFTPPTAIKIALMQCVPCDYLEENASQITNTGRRGSTEGRRVSSNGEPGANRNYTPCKAPRLIKMMENRDFYI